MSNYKILSLSAALVVALGSTQPIYSQNKSAEAVEKSKETSKLKVKGKVVDGLTGAPIVGASVSVPQYTAKITDQNGAFEISVPTMQINLEVAIVGYQTVVVPANKTDLTVTLYPEGTKSFYAETYTPFAQDVKHVSQMVGAVDVVDFQGAWEQNSETVDNYLQGKLAGVNVTRKSGTPSMGANIAIRGLNSLYTQNQPLYIIDGLIYNAEIHSSSITNGHENNPLQNIDVRDIESVTVLKDAVATAIYGAKAANGVIVITTHRAKELTTKIDFEVSSGFNQTPKRIPVMNAFNYRSYLNDVLATSTLTGEEIAALPFNNDSKGFIDYPVYHNETDWQNKVFKTELDKSYYLRVTGGDNIAKYALSVGFNDDNGVIANTQQNKYTARFNSDLSLTKRLKAQTNISLGYGQQKLKDQGFAPNTNPIFLALTKAPFFNTNELAPDGTVSPNYAPADYFGYSNPLQLIYNGVNDKKSYRFLGGVNFDFKLTDHINLSNTTGITYDKAQENFFIPAKGIASEIINNTVVTSRLGTQVARYFSITNDFRAAYAKTINDKDKFNAIVGLRYQHHDAEQDYALGYNSATDDLVSIGNSDAAKRTFGGNIGEWANVTFYGLANYAIDNRFIINAAISLDGSSRFGSEAEGGVNVFEDHPFGVFPSIGGAWIISSENFLKDNKNINLLKYRISYGLVGNDDIGNYNAKQNYVSQNFLGVQGLVRDGVSNPYLRWETVRKFNTGFDLSMFKERFNLSIDYYNNQTDKMLAYQNGNTLSGIAYYLDNSGKMETNGLDLSLFGKITTGKVKWDAGLSVGTYKTKVTSLPETVYTNIGGATYITKVGEAPNAFYGYQFKGVFSTQAQASAAGLSRYDEAGNKIAFEAGDAIFADKDNNKVIDENDRYVIGDPNPDFYGGFNNSISYKKWSLGALFTFSVGNDAYNYTRANLESGNGLYNQTDALLNRWRADGQVTNIPRVTYEDPMGNARFSDRWVEDASYLRLRQLSLAYKFTFNKSIVNYLNIYATANNLFTLTKYLGYDPEFSMNTDVYRQGIDATLEPQFKSFQLGVRLGL
ncbi:SusC/RagA family TonB-linked outer membrane protein [Pelobium manganitolerans]|uniref:SusC/RagA family TonB-linked outer membrane protein n=1 Tax=Pelobium manganitolerans TaxID=1842495 RepID=UPI003FA3DC3A